VFQIDGMPYSFKIFCANFNHGNSNSCNTRHLITNYTELTISFLYPLFFLDQYEIFLNKCLRKPKGQSRMDNPEKTKGAIKNGQSRENQRSNQEWTIQRKPKGQSRMDNPETLATLGNKTKNKDK
jgi:hypothetical protein